MEKKRVAKSGLVLSLAFVMLSVFASSFVNAGISEDITNAIDNVIVKPLNPVFKFIVGDSPDGTYLLVKLLAMIVILAVAYSAARKVPGLQDSKFLSFIVGLIIAILGTRYLTSPELVEFLWLPSGVFGVVVATLLPFILFFFLIESFESRVIRKVGWIAFGVIFFTLAIYRWDALKTGSAFYQNLGWVYVVIAVLSLLAVYFDKQLRARFVLRSMGKDLSKKNLVTAAYLMDDIEDQIKVRNRAINSGDNKVQAYAEKEIARLQGEIAKLK